MKEHMKRFVTGAAVLVGFAAMVTLLARFEWAALVPAALATCGLAYLIGSVIRIDR